MHLYLIYSRLIQFLLIIMSIIFKGHRCMRTHLGNTIYIKYILRILIYYEMV